MANILVAGAGKLGLPLARLLVAAGHRVSAIRRSDPPPVAEGIHWYCLDLEEPASLAPLARDYDQAVIILTPASRSPEGYERAYQHAQDNLLAHLDGSRTRPACLFVSATSVYAQDDGGWVDETSPAEPASYNGRSLLAAEHRILEYSPAPLVIRFAGIYGPARRRLLDQLRKPLSIQRSPPLYTNRVHQDDCIAILDFLAARQREGSNRHTIYIGADHCPAPKFEMMTWLAEAAGLAAPTPVDAPDDAPRGKRCSNRRLLDSGYAFRYPGYREGYAGMLNPADGE